jgi:ADP-L-glycero-D-manno-heptose 6-epimerase
MPYLYDMIVITGAAGFIGSNLVTGLNEHRYGDLILVDDFSRGDRERYYADKQFSGKVERSDFSRWLGKNHRFVQMVLHMGARTDTTESSWEVFRELNLDYSREVFNRCVEFGLPLIYASSAATYGAGEHGYDDSHEIVPKLEPLNPYGRSKNEFDRWVLGQDRQPFYWAGLKFFNVYGPNEYHKGRMASVVFHTYRQIRETGEMKLFRSHHPDYRDGEQARDFIYVKDVVDVIIHLMENRPFSGLFNVGTGRASTFRDLAEFTFRAMGKQPRIKYIDTPEDIREKYQYFTQAETDKLRDAGYDRDFTPLEDGIREYVREYLMDERII